MERQAQFLVHALQPRVMQYSLGIADSDLSGINTDRTLSHSYLVASGGSRVLQKH